MKNYITNEMYEQAKHSDISIDFGLTKSIYLTFGTYGLCLHNITKGKDKNKHINNWKAFTSNELNQQLSKLA